MEIFVPVVDADLLLQQGRPEGFRVREHRSSVQLLGKSRVTSDVGNSH